ncbi:hypothetical protein ACUTAH_24610 [Metapseudomonas furukawaii]|uniref:hypothetical protein n=1 Tax=Metapseudomonas furukawaii TaxID=1149133 RepID=UPI0040459D63
MLDWFANAATSIGVAKDITQSLINLRDGELVRAKVFELTSSLMELQQQLMTAQQEQMGLLQMLREKDAQIAELKEDADVFSQYALLKLGRGFAYELKPEFNQTGDCVYCCPQCFQSKKLSFLNRRPQPGGHWVKFTCHACQYSAPVP